MGDNTPRGAFPKNPLTAKCLFKKSNSKVLVSITHHTRKAFSKNPPTESILTMVGGFSDQALYSWGIIGTSTSQLVHFPSKHSAVSGFFELALCS